MTVVLMHCKILLVSSSSLTAPLTQHQPLSCPCFTELVWSLSKEQISSCDVCCGVISTLSVFTHGCCRSSSCLFPPLLSQTVLLAIAGVTGVLKGMCDNKFGDLIQAPNPQLGLPPLPAIVSSPRLHSVQCVIHHHLLLCLHFLLLSRWITAVEWHPDCLSVNSPRFSLSGHWWPSSVQRWHWPAAWCEQWWYKCPIWELPPKMTQFQCNWI